MSINDKITKKTEKIFNAYEKFLRKENKFFRNIYNKASLDTNALILALYEAIPDLTSEELKQGMALIEAKKFGRLDKTFNAIEKEIRGMNSISNGAIGVSLAGAYSLGKLGTGWSLETTLNLNNRMGFKPIDKKEFNKIKFSDKYETTWQARNTSNNARLFNKIKNTLTQELNKGTSYIKTAKMVKNQFAKFEVINKQTRVSGGLADALRIVRTETHRALNEGKWSASELAKKSANRIGYEIRRQIVSIIDSKTRNQSIEVNGRFENKQGYFEYPGGVFVSVPGNSGVAAWDINDRETWVDVVFDGDNVINPDPVSEVSPEEWIKINDIKDKTAKFAMGLI